MSALDFSFSRPFLNFYCKLGRGERVPSGVKIKIVGESGPAAVHYTSDKIINSLDPENCQPTPQLETGFDYSSRIL